MRTHYVVIGTIAGIVLGGVLGVLLVGFTKSKEPALTIYNTPSPVEIISPSLSPTPVDFCLDVPVLFYHHIQPLDKAEEHGETSLSVAPGNFDWHIRYLLEKGYTFISLSELVDSLINRNPLHKAIVLTLDDGYRDNYIYAFPIVKKHHVPITIALSTWFSGKFEEHLSWTQIREMFDSGLVSFVNHSFSHRSLALSDTSVLDQQILEAQEALENTIGPTQKILIYPYGKYNEFSKNYLASHEFQAAFSTEKGTRHCLSTIYELPRLRIGNAGPGVYGL